MASEHDPEREAGGSPDPDIVQRLDAIDGSLLDHIENDARLQSGVPAGQRPTDLDFIQMSGLTRPGNQARPHSGEVATSLEEPDLDTSKPLSFFERGIADVDGDMTPQAPDHIEDPEHLLRTGSPHTQPDELIDFNDIPTANTPEMRMSHTPDLEEAEQLLQALENQPREFPVPTRENAPPLPQTVASPVSLAETSVSAGIPAAQEPGSDSVTIPAHILMPATISANAPQSFSEVEDEKAMGGGYDYPLAIDLDPEKAEDAKDERSEERDASVYTKPMPGKHTRRSRSSSHTWRRLLKLVILFVLLLFFVGGIVVITKQYHQRTQPSIQAFELAQQTKDAGNFREASDAFKNFAATHPDDPLKAEAEFQAAFCMQQTPTPTTPFDEQKACKTAALDLYKQFVANNPAHEKATRAKVFVGLLSVELELYPEGIEILQNPDLLLGDPDSALPALHALAVARLKVGNRDAAASAYLQAMALSRNYTPEIDLEALANIYSDQAADARNEEDRKRFLKQAVDRLNDAIRLPTVDPSDRNTLQTKRDYILKELGEPIPENEGNNPPPGENKPAVPAPNGMPEPLPPAPAANLEPPASIQPEATPNTTPSAATPSVTEPAATTPITTVLPAQPTAATPAVPTPAPTAPAVATPDPNLETQYPGTTK